MGGGGSDDMVDDSMLADRLVYNRHVEVNGTVKNVENDGSFLVRVTCEALPLRALWRLFRLVGGWGVKKD